MASQHTSRFNAIVDDARARVRECTIPEFKNRIDQGGAFRIVDVREESEFASGHVPNAIHLSKGVIERDIERTIPDLNAEIYLYCGGGFRSVLAAENLQKMGYTNVTSVDGGWRGWTQEGYPTTK